MASTPPEDVRTTELIGGVERRDLVLVPYDLGWVGSFEAERGRITQAMGTRALLVEHVGSTAVPGLAAKPIIDILVTVDNIADEAEYLPPLVEVGYQLRTREPGHRLFRTPDLGVHIHLLQDGSEAARAYLDLRDRLRRSERARLRYTAAKQAAIETGVTDMNAYSDLKSDVIAAIRAADV